MSKRFLTVRYWLLLLFLPLLLLLASCSSGETNSESSETSQEGSSNEDTENTAQFYHWGVDSASVVDQQLLQCVRENFGEPAYFGRYLETKEGVSYGLTEQEVNLLKDNGVKILPIYNHFTDATTYEKGAAEARQAIQYAEEIGVPEGVSIFADIEPSYPVDKDFMVGWAETMRDSPYNPGIYGVFVEESESNVLAAYLEFEGENPELSNEVAIWTSDISVGITTKEKAPEFRPENGDQITMMVWQYGIDAEACNIDTNLLRNQFLDDLW